jgi:hypothetical protein
MSNPDMASGKIGLFCLMCPIMLRQNLRARHYSLSVAPTLVTLRSSCRVIPFLPYDKPLAIHSTYGLCRTRRTYSFC